MTMSVMFAFGWCNLIGHGDAMQIRMQIADDTVGLTAQNVYYTAQLSVINCPFVLVSERFSSAIYAYHTVNCQHKQN